MGLGTIHIMKRPIWHGEGEGFMADSLDFDLNKPFMVGKKHVHGKSPVPGKMSPLPCAPSRQGWVTPAVPPGAPWVPTMC